jgi:hypothetical protein
MGKPCLVERIRICGGWGEAPPTTDTVLFSGQGGSSSPCWGRSSGAVGIQSPCGQVPHHRRRSCARSYTCHAVSETDNRRRHR